MGIGMAMTESTFVDPKTGRYMNADLAEYHVPSHADITPNMDVFFVDESDDAQVNPIGVKGVGDTTAPTRGTIWPTLESSYREESCDA